MKQYLLVFGITVFAGTAAIAQATKKTTTTTKTTTKPVAITKTTAPAPLKSQLDSFSYALGLNIANNLKQQGIDNVSSASMLKGLQDVFAKKTILLNEQQANACIQITLQETMKKRNDIVRSKGEAFLAENKKKKGVITLPDGLQYEVIMKGDANSPKPKLIDTVVANYKGTLIDGKQFDNSYERGEPLTIPVGGVIRGWTEILQLMNVGDKYKVYIPSELGYGERGAGQDIPGGSVLIFEMELLSIKPALAIPATTPPATDSLKN